MSPTPEPHGCSSKLLDLAMVSGTPDTAVQVKVYVETINPLASNLEHGCPKGVNVWGGGCIKLIPIFTLH